METMIQFLSEDGVTTATIIVLLALYKEIRGIGKEVKSFYDKLFLTDGTPRYRRTIDCDNKMAACHALIDAIRLETLQHNSLISKNQYQIETLMAQAAQKRYNNKQTKGEPDEYNI